MSEEVTPQSPREARLARLREKSEAAKREHAAGEAEFETRSLEDFEAQYLEEIKRELQELDPETWTPDVIHKTMAREVHFWRQAYAATLGPERVEADWSYEQTMEPYGDWPVPDELQQVGREGSKALEPWKDPA